MKDSAELLLIKVWSLITKFKAKAKVTVWYKDQQTQNFEALGNTVLTVACHLRF